VGVKFKYHDMWSYSMSWVWASEHVSILWINYLHTVASLCCKNHPNSTTTTSMPLKACQRKKMNIHQPNLPHFIPNTCLQCGLSLHEGGCEYSVICLHTAVSQQSCYDVNKL
jgi:hypothetical protein